MNELSRLGRRLEREIMARVEAEHLLEEKSRELFHANAALSRHAAELDQEVGLKAQELLVAQRVARIGTLIHDLREDAWRVSDGLHLLLDHDPLVQTLDVGRLIDAVHPDDRDLALGIVRPALQDTAVEGERMELVRCVLANGDLIWVELRSELVLAPDGAPHQLVCTVQNITDKKHNELAILESRMQISMRVAELERARAELEMARDDAERASHIKDRFLAIMSHEIRTPLNGVFGALQLLAEDEPDSARREMLSLALHSAEDLRRVTNDVIDMSRLALDQIRIESERFELAALCQDVSDFWRPVAGAKGLQLHCQIAPGLSSGVSGDSGRIRQIINSLVSNAIKFSDEGAVTLRLTSTATAELDRARFRIEV